MGVKGFAWNGGGQTLLSKERRRELAEMNSRKAIEKNSGWPKSIQKEGLTHTYELATREWADRMAWSKGR